MGGGFLSNVMSTAAGVSLGHAISGYFSGGNNSEDQAAASQDQPPAQVQANQQQALQQAEQGPCGYALREYASCVAQNSSNIDGCGWLLEQFRSCQASMAAQQGGNMQ